MATKGRKRKLAQSRCAVEHCMGRVLALGLCPIHYQRKKRGVVDSLRKSEESLPPRPKWEYLGNEAALVATQER